MIITQIAVEGVGKFRARHVVHGLGPGLNLLCAPNETGKSTIFRALQTCLFFRHDANTKETRALACLGTQLPARIAIGFTRDATEYRVEKAFLRSASSRFYQAGKLIAEGRAADEAVWSILGIEPGSRMFEDSAFGLFWVRQGQSFEPMQPSEDMRAMLSRAIEAEVGQVLGGERGERVLASIAAQLASEETKAGHPKTGGRWKAAIEHAGEMGAALASVRATLDALEADRQALFDKLRERAKLADAAAQAQMQADLDAATQERAAADVLDHAAEKAEGEAARRELANERAQHKLQRLIERDERIKAIRASIAALDRQIEAQDAARAAQSATHVGHDRALKDLAERLEAADCAVGQARSAEAAAKDAERVVELQGRLGQARDLRDRISQLQQATALIAITSDELRKLEKAAQDLDAALARREAKAPRVAVRLGPDGQGRVTCGDEPVMASGDFAVVEPLHIAIDRIAAIEIVPAATPEDAEAIERARRKLDRDLRAAGVRSLAEARERRAKAEDLTTEQRGLAAELAILAPAGGGTDGVAWLEAALNEAQGKRDAAGPPGQDTGDPQALLARRLAAEQDREALRREHHDLQMVVLAARGAVVAETERLAALRADRAGLEVKLQENLAQCPDRERPEQLIAFAAEAAQAQALFVDGQGEAQRLRAAVPGAEQRSSLDARVKRLTVAIAGRQARLQELERDIAGLQGRIASRGGEGLGEREAELAEVLALAEKERARIERHLAALRLLRETIESCRRDARETFLAPVKRAMKPYLHTLFPGADAEIDERFLIGGVQRSSPEIEPFASLSDGTREQIAIIVRLAFGRLVAERGRPVPVVLDDALVFSDDERIERMFDVLMQAAEQQQILMLTCRGRAFQSCGGRPLVIEPDAADRLESAGAEVVRLPRAARA
jgi:DNA repair exonuclease SbcCD ATPase subunit